VQVNEDHHSLCHFATEVFNDSKTPLPKSAEEDI